MSSDILRIGLVALVIFCAGCGDAADSSKASSKPAPDPLARLIADESGDVDARLDAMSAVTGGASRAVIDALLLVMKDRSQQAFLTVPDDSDLGFHVQESPFGGADVRRELRWTALLALERLGVKDALPDFLAAMYDRDGVVRNHAARAAWRLGHPRGLEVLVKGLEGRAFENETANRILKEITGQDFGFDTDGGHTLKQAAIERWKERVAGGVKNPTALPLKGEEDGLDRRVRFLIAMLGQHQFLFMEQARRTLSELGDLTVEHLEVALPEARFRDNQQLRAYAVQVLRNIGTPRARALLLKLLDAQGPVRSRAAGALGELAHAAATPRLLALLDDADESVVVASARALGRLKAEDAKEKLLAHLQRQTASARLKLTAAGALVRIGGTPEGGRYLLERMENGPLHERADLAEFLEEWHGNLMGFDPNRPGTEQAAALEAWRKIL